MAARTILAALALCLPLAAQTAPPNELKIYFIDVEGGQATLFRTPTGQSLLIDTGWPGNDARDAKRIAAAAKDAGISKIDFVLLTHYHDDHVGGVPQLAALMPIGAFIDHGPNREPGSDALEAAYQKTLADGHYQHIVAEPGDTLPITGIQATVISADGNVKGPMAPGAPNPFCKTAPPFPADKTENARSLGTEIMFGELRILDLGDLTQDKELQLACPNNTLGQVDILIVSHHGWAQSSNPAFIDAIAPRVAIMDNGATKGGSTAVLDTIRNAPSHPDLWQLHYSEEGGTQHNSDDRFIANLTRPDDAHFLKLVAASNGAFEIFNTRTSTSRSYSPKH